MSVQIAVRLPEEIVDFIDSEVTDNRAASRAAVVLRALERERRRRAAERDAEILAGEPDTDLDRLAAIAARVELEIE